MQIKPAVPAGTKAAGSERIYNELFPVTFADDFHAVISLPHDAGVKLGEGIGFEKGAPFREVGFKFGRWIDVGYLELIVNKDRGPK